ncbi:response regulator [Desulfosporosinus sp. FKA]|uniref:response regulator n=1 Tax=Desulfosporosinus sp. FKA TaxID=1969834 RepID=UPI000B49A300|nr:response regulator [Desulfosporosinus sp. FKA]
MKKAGTKILVIDNETQIRRLLRVTLTGHGYVVKDVDTGKDGLDAVVKFAPDLVLLSIELPDINGFDVLRELHGCYQIPVIILSYKNQETDMITALDNGAYDYMAKPFGVGELLARIRTALRHVAESREHFPLKFDDLKIDFAHQQVFKEGKEVMLTPTEYKIVKKLAIHSGKVFTHTSLMSAVWGHPSKKNIQDLRVFIGQIRRKLEQDPSRPRHIITEPGIGYRLL